MTVFLFWNAFPVHPIALRARASLETFRGRWGFIPADTETDS
jgi:hypothetical protein